VKSEKIQTNDQRFYLLDHDLKKVSDMSHSITFAEAFLESQATTEIWAHYSCDLDHPSVRGVFSLSQGTINRLASRGAWPVLRKINHLMMLVRANASYYFALRRGARPPIGDGTILFVSNPSPFVVPALQLFGFLNSHAKVVLWFGRPITRSVKFLGTIHRILHLQNLRYCAGIPKLAELYQFALSLPCHVVPSPLPQQHDCKPIADSVLPYIGLVLGQPRQSKGFDIFVDALEHLAGPLQQGRLQLVVQSLPIDRAEPSLRRWVTRLSVLSRDHSHIKVMIRALNREEYENLLAQCDFVILPYRQKSYLQQDSGIAVEALANGKPSVITEGLSFVPMASAYNAMVGVPDGDPVGLANGIVRLIDDLPTYRRSAAKAAEEFKREHSIHSVFKHLISLFRGQSC
jgi:glycosyltransferase involved in cell wall biosynthesis